MGFSHRLVAGPLEEAMVEAARSHRSTQVPLVWKDPLEKILQALLTRHLDVSAEGEA
jgi:hypothetical protein